MEESSKKINYIKKSVPTTPGAAQITVVGQESKKGGSEMVSKLPEKYMIPGPDSKKGFSSK